MARCLPTDHAIYHQTTILKLYNANKPFNPMTDIGKLADASDEEVEKMPEVLNKLNPAQASFFKTETVIYRTKTFDFSIITRQDMPPDSGPTMKK